MAAEQLHFDVTVTSEIQRARGPKWFPENVRVFLGTFETPQEVKMGWEGLTLEIARERAAQARKEPGTKSVDIFLAE